MSSYGLGFVGYADSVDEANVVVDGSPNVATVLVLSHWPAMPTPPDCAADTSCQMAFRYLDRGADLHGDAAAVTNNHFDQDGLAGIYALTDPGEALRRRSRVEGLASAGDFAVAPDRTSARLSAAVSRLAEPDRSPLDLPDDHDERCVVLYEHALRELPGWLDDPESCRSLWQHEEADFEAGATAISSGAVRIDEHPDVDLAVVTLAESGRSSGHRFAGRVFGGVHPMALHEATDRSVILVIDPAEGRHHLTCRYEGWVQFRSRTIRPRVDLAPLALELTAADTGDVRWTSTPPSDLTPELWTDPAYAATSIAPADLVDTARRHLANAPVAWDPYRDPDREDS